MSTCQRFEQVDLAHWEARGELPREHLRDCPDCVRSYQRYARIIETLRHDDTPPLPREWQTRVLETVRRGERGFTSELALVVPRVETEAPAARRTAHWRELLRPALAATLLAVAVALVCVRPWRRGSDLPAYAAELLGGDSALRDAAAPRSFRPGAPLDIVLRPARAVTGDVGARAFVLDGEVVELRAQILVLPKGVLRLKTSAPSAAITRARRMTIAVIVARPDALERAVRAVTGPDPEGRPPITLTLELRP